MIKKIRGGISPIDENLQSNNAVLKGIIDSFDNPLFSVDTNYCYTSFNISHAFVMKTLYGVEIALGINILECQTVEADRIKAKANLDRSLHGERVIEEAFSGEESRAKRYFGVSHHPMRNAQGAVSGVAVYARDITEEKRALHQIEMLSRFPSENPNPVLRVSLDGTTQYVNDAASQKNGWGYVVGEITPQFLKEAIKNAAKGNKYHEFEAFINERFYSIGIAPIMEYGYVNVYGRDITELKKTQKALSELNAKLETRIEERTKELKVAQERLLRDEKLAAIGKISGSISHELRNPLTTINNSSYFLKTKLEKVADAKINRHLDLIQQEVQRSLNIITGMLEFSRLKVPTRTLVNVQALLESTIDNMQKPENIRVERKFDANLPLIQVDKGQMQQVFTNLIMNSMEAMVDGGTLEITATSQNNDMVITFADTGSGINGENQPRIFEPLFTTKIKGIGLGLALIKEIVQKHDGTITFESTVGVGTKFKIVLPLNTESSEKERTDIVLA
jgi:signal transduction histidine kinase